MSTRDLFLQVLPIAVPIVLGIVVPSLVDCLKSVSARLDGASTIVKNVVAVVVAALSTALTTWVGSSDLAGTVLTWDNATWQAVLAAAIGIALKRGAQLKAAR